MTGPGSTREVGELLGSTSRTRKLLDCYGSNGSAVTAVLSSSHHLVASRSAFSTDMRSRLQFPDIDRADHRPRSV